MGDLHTMAELKTSGQMTGQQIADKLKKSPDALRKLLSRTADRYPDVFPDRSWSVDRTFTSEQVYLLSGKKKASVRTVRKEQPKPITPHDAKPDRKEVPARSWLSNFELDAINLIEMGLICYGLTMLYGPPGTFLAAMCCLYLFKTQSIAKDNNKPESQEKAIEVVWWINFAGVFLHSITFYNAIEIPHESGRFSLMLLLHLVAAIGPALYVSVFSFKAVTTTKSLTSEQ